MMSQVDFHIQKVLTMLRISIKDLRCPRLPTTQRWLSISSQCWWCVLCWLATLSLAYGLSPMLIDKGERADRVTTVYTAFICSPRSSV